MLLFSSDKSFEREREILRRSSFLVHGHLEVFCTLVKSENGMHFFPPPEISITKTDAELTRNVSSMCSAWQTLQAVARKHVMFINTIWLVLS